MEEGDTVVVRCTSYITQSLKKATQQYILQNRLASSEVFLHAKKYKTRYHNPPYISDTYRCESLFPEDEQKSPKICKPNQSFVKPSLPKATFAFSQTHTLPWKHTKLRGRFRLSSPALCSSERTK